MRTREKARCIFLWDISTAIQGAVIGRKRWGWGEHSMERVLDAEGLEKGPIITWVLGLFLVLDWRMLTKANEERLTHFGTRL